MVDKCGEFFSGGRECRVHIFVSELFFLQGNNSPIGRTCLGIGTGRRRRKIGEDVDWSLVLDILNCDLRCCILIFCLEWSEFFICLCISFFLSDHK